MRWQAGALAGMALMLGCSKAPQSSPPDAASNTTTPAAEKLDPLAELRRLAPGARSAVLFRAISDAHAACSKVIGSSYQQDYRKMAMFVARCPGAGPYAVFVSPTGYAQVSACAALGPGVPDCHLAPK